MKKIIIGILTTIACGTHSFAQVSDTCIAQKVSRTGYASALKYHVNCSNNTEFDAPEILTAFLFPIPYQWGKVARRKLSRVMLEKGYIQVSTIDESPKIGLEAKAFPDPLLIFGKINTNATYCAVLEKNHQKVGINRKLDIYDYSVSCNKNNPYENLKAITRAELGAHMRKIGVKFSFHAKPVQTTDESLILIFEGK